MNKKVEIVPVPEPDVIVVDRVPSVMSNVELADAAHAFVHELFRRLEPNFYHAGKELDQ